AAHPHRHRRAQHDPRRGGRQRAPARDHGRCRARRAGARGAGLQRPLPDRRRGPGGGRRDRPRRLRGGSGRPPAARPVPGLRAPGHARGRGRGGTMAVPHPPSRPMSSVNDLLALGRDRYLPVYRQRELVLERGEGARVWDSEGREYVDFAAGIAVCSLGHADPDLVRALVEQAGRLWHTSNVFHSEPPLRLADELVRASRFAERVFLCNSGAEANEAAIKLVRKWAAGQGRGPDQRGIVTFRGSFHGRTLATVTATAQPRYQAGYEPLPGGFHYVDYNDLAAVEAAMAGGGVA